MHNIVVDYEPKETDKKVIYDGMLAFSEQVLGDRAKWFEKFFSVMLKDESHNIQGGILAKFDSESIYVDMLWIAENLRHQGYGTKLLKAAETEAIKLGCRFSTVDTYSFQAEDFYLKNGYERFGEIKNYYLQYSRIFLRKEL